MFLFSKNLIGLDIADHSIEVAELEKKGDVKVANLGRVKLAPGIVEMGRVKDEQKLLEAIKKVFSVAKPKAISGKDIIFGLPESQVYTNVFVLKSENSNKREQLIFEEAKRNVPLPEEDLVYSYKILDKRGDEEEILLVSASKKTILEWISFFKKANLNIEIFDIETLAIRRVLMLNIKDQISNTMIIDIGSRTTNIAIFDKKGLRYSYSVLKAGNFLTQEISKCLKITKEEAEKKKIEAANLTKNNQLDLILIKALEPILEEIKQSLKYLINGEIILVGGSSRLKGLVDYLSSNLDVKVRIGSSILDGKFTEALKSKTLSSKKDSLLYLEAIGLALRGIDNQWEKKDPAFKIADFKQKDTKKISNQKITKKTEEYLSQFESDNVWPDKLHKQKIILIFILVVGFTLIGASFWYRSYQRSRKELIQDMELKSKVSILSNNNFDEPKEVLNLDQQIIKNEEIFSEDVSIINNIDDTETKKVEEVEKRILIKNTPTGWLNVREGPGTIYPVISKVNPGESYVVIDEKGDWIKIKLPEDKLGWVYSKYVDN